MIICHKKNKIKQINNNKLRVYVKSIQKFNNIKKLLSLISLLFILFAIHYNTYLLLLISTNIFFIIILYIPSQIKKYVADISCYFIKRYTTEYHHKNNVSMYIIAEKYSDTYKIPSLIDIIFYTDYIDRMGWIIGIGIIIATYTVYPEYILYIIICYYLTLYLISRCYIKLSFSCNFISIKKPKYIL